MRLFGWFRHDPRPENVQKFGPPLSQEDLARIDTVAGDEDATTGPLPTDQQVAAFFGNPEDRVALQRQLEEADVKSLLGFDPIPDEHQHEIDRMEAEGGPPHPGLTSKEEASKQPRTACRQRLPRTQLCNRTPAFLLPDYFGQLWDPQNRLDNQHGSKRNNLLVMYLHILQTHTTPDVCTNADVAAYYTGLQPDVVPASVKAQFQSVYASLYEKGLVFRSDGRNQPVNLTTAGLEHPMKRVQERFSVAFNVKDVRYFRQKGVTFGLADVVTEGL